jgi:hypothetical protein
VLETKVLKVAESKLRKASGLLETIVCWKRASHGESFVSDCLGSVSL